MKHFFRGRFALSISFILTILLLGDLPRELALVAYNFELIATETIVV
jgi:hypothetical protein